MKLSFIGLVYLFTLPVLFAQQVKTDTLKTPPISYFRAEEDHSYLRYQGSDSILVAKDIFDPVKFIPVDGKKQIWFSLGGQYRPRYEFFNRQFLMQANGSDGYYSQRLTLHASLNLTENFRVFSELYHGLLSRDGDVPVQDDPLALHQLFIEPKIKMGDARVSLRLGRQEMSYGISRLIGMREGPNIRLSFDAARFMFERESTSIHAFYGQEVTPNFEVFKDKRNRAMDFWGLYSQFYVDNTNGFTTDLYYLGLNRDQTTFETTSAEETRHTVGLRMSGKNGLNVNYNTELIYQFGTFGNQNISSFAAEFDYNYALTDTRLSPVLGIKLDYIMGDRDANDDKLNTFNSLFANPTYFGLSGTIAPTNLLDLHPSVRLSFTEKISALLDWDILWRASTDDGVYAPAGFLLFSGTSNKNRFIGHEPGIKIHWFVDRHLDFKGEFSYLIPGKFIRSQGGDRLTYFSVTGSYKI